MSETMQPNCRAEHATSCAQISRVQLLCSGRSLVIPTASPKHDLCRTRALCQSWLPFSVHALLDVCSVPLIYQQILTVFGSHISWHGLCGLC